ncbi:hypothetical protein FGG08_003916 [Glutinoglossum americanum]|uniref:Protein kinase domain-containing protein n=1 Tax=Glutinoglossum americanum TaxID=1670608 RepID=A0A9P8L4D3_9PEZI|nr:hypothetical protein FGG08_003916 [Glutinoglossum americanum]
MQDDRVEDDLLEDDLGDLPASSITTMEYDLRTIDEGMAESFPKLRSNATEYTDLDVERVSELLRWMDHETWSHVPRLYIVLHRIGYLNLLNDFIALRITDFWFPFTQLTLPSLLGPSDQIAFLQQQQCVLTKATHLERDDSGEHRHFSDREHIPFQSKAILGTGGFSQVEKVVSLISFREYARKLIYRKKAFGEFQQSMPDFERELKILKRVRHRHIVELVGSYTDPKYAALIMSLVADCDLSQFLTEASSSANSMSLMRTFFGCLATALSYLHDLSIRHKDIKPSNFLVKDGTVLLTDFGLSLDCSDLTRSTTEGLTPLTRRYWSLGCVFLEMTNILKGKSLDDMKSFLESNGSQTAMYWSNPAGTKQWVTKLKRSAGKEANNSPLMWIKKMLMHNREKRPTARVLVMEIVNEGSASDKAGEFCGICCRMDDEPSYLDSGSGATSQALSRDSDLTPSDTVPPSVESAISRPPPLSNTGPDALHNVFAGLRIEQVPSAKISTQSYCPNNHAQAKYFILRSTSEMDIESSVAHGVWVSSRRVNVILDRALSEAGGSVILFFSVVGSKEFCGVAEMTSSVDYDNTDEHWTEDL